jgi:hypothetical protein
MGYLARVGNYYWQQNLMIPNNIRKVTHGHEWGSTMPKNNDLKE